MAECIDTVAEGHPQYKAPQRGYQRAVSGLKTVWVACGPHASTLILTGSVQLPFRISKRFATACGSFIGKHVVSGLVKNALRTTQPGNPWAQALEQDKFGLYSRLCACAASESSLARDCCESSEANENALSDFNLRSWFEKRNAAPALAS
jgi:hypothetical protein